MKRVKFLSVHESVLRKWQNRAMLLFLKRKTINLWHNRWTSWVFLPWSCFFLTKQKERLEIMTGMMWESRQEALVIQCLEVRGNRFHFPKYIWFSSSDRIGDDTWWSNACRVRGNNIPFKSKKCCIHWWPRIPSHESHDNQKSMWQQQESHDLLIIIVCIKQREKLFNKKKNKKRVKFCCFFCISYTWQERAMYFFSFIVIRKDVSFLLLTSIAWLSNCSRWTPWFPLTFWTTRILHAK